MTISKKSTLYRDKEAIAKDVLFALVELKKGDDQRQISYAARMVHRLMLRM